MHPRIEFERILRHNLLKIIDSFFIGQAFIFSYVEQLPPKGNFWDSCASSKIYHR